MHLWADGQPDQRQGAVGALGDVERRREPVRRVALEGGPQAFRIPHCGQVVGSGRD